MKLLITADSHLSTPMGGRFLETLSSVLKQELPDAVVIAGDLGDVHFARFALSSLRQTVGDFPLLVCLGNHDFWMDEFHEEYADLAAVRSRVWVEVSKEYDVSLLDLENVEFGDCVIVGGYGHFDLGLAMPHLSIDGRLINREQYLLGGIDRLYWNDFRFIPHCAANLDHDANNESAGVATRLEQAAQSGKRIIVAMHTCPWIELNGHPITGKATDMLAAYSGNAAIGRNLEVYGSQIDLVACGHTHFQVRQREIGGIARCLNVGSDYGVMRGVVFDTDTKGIKWVGVA